MNLETIGITIVPPAIRQIFPGGTMAKRNSHIWQPGPTGWLLALAAVVITACGGGSGGSGGIIPTPPPTPSTAHQWTWINGSKTVGATGVYTTLGTPSATNVPSARGGAVSWADKSGNLWLFGGQGNGSNNGDLNDLWEFSPTNKTWTWVSGSDTTGASGVYGSPGIPSPSNVPGARNGAVSWTDKKGNFWLFGGQGFGAAGSGGDLDDLWEFSPTTTEWTAWVSSNGNVGARTSAVSWTDSNGNFWLFGGDSTNGPHNDLWIYSPANNTWTWESGSNTPWATGVYGTLGTPSATNIPGSRHQWAASWIDGSSNLWLFGGQHSLAMGGNYNDLWEFTPATKAWTWVSGSDTTGASGVYGILGTPSLTNVPGARTSAVSWTDSNGNFWLFGGSNYSAGMLNDLWEFNPTNKMWTWMGGSSSIGASGIYGTLGTPSTGNVPGARAGAVSWVDTSGNFWLFGGGGLDGAGGGGVLNDLWHYEP